MNSRKPSSPALGIWISPSGLVRDRPMEEEQRVWLRLASASPRRVPAPRRAAPASPRSDMVAQAQGCPSSCARHLRVREEARRRRGCLIGGKSLPGRLGFWPLSSKVDRDRPLFDESDICMSMIVLSSSFSRTEKSNKIVALKQAPPTQQILSSKSSPLSLSPIFR